MQATNILHNSFLENLNTLFTVLFVYFRQSVSPTDHSQYTCHTTEGQILSHAFRSMCARSRNFPSSSSSIGSIAHCGLWPFEQCPSIYS